MEIKSEIVSSSILSILWKRIVVRRKIHTKGVQTNLHICFKFKMEKMEASAPHQHALARLDYTFE